MLPPLYVWVKITLRLKALLIIVLDTKSQLGHPQAHRRIKIQKVCVNANIETTPVDISSLDYLTSVVHSSAFCDLCMTPIQGEWFRCAYCTRDLCDACEEVDTHDDTHVFIVFKSLVSDIFVNSVSLLIVVEFPGGHAALQVSTIQCRISLLSSFFLLQERSPISRVQLEALRLSPIRFIVEYNIILHHTPNVPCNEHCSIMHQTDHEMFG